MKSVPRLLAVLVVGASVAGGVHPVAATSGFESGACLLDLSATLSSDTLTIGTVGPGLCVTNEVPDLVGEGGLGASLPGIVGFSCTDGRVVGFTHNGNGGMTIRVDGDIILSADDMTIAAASDGATLTIAFHWQSALRVIVGKGVFALETDSPSCSSGNPTTWTGEIVFADPALP